MTPNLAAGCLTLAQGKGAFLAGLLLGAAIVMHLAILSTLATRHRRVRTLVSRESESECESE